MLFNPPEERIAAPDHSHDRPWDRHIGVIVEPEATLEVLLAPDLTHLHLCRIQSLGQAQRDIQFSELIANDQAQRPQQWIQHLQRFSTLVADSDHQFNILSWRDRSLGKSDGPFQVIISVAGHRHLSYRVLR